VQNSQCQIDATNSSASGSGNNLTLNVAITFFSSYAGGKNIYVLAQPSQFDRFDAGILFIFNKGTAKVSTTF
jgi:hypothetical protein